MDAETSPLIEAIAAFIDRHSMSPVTFGRKAMNDPHFVGQIEGGRRVWPETEAKVRRFMAEYRPESASASAPAQQEAA